MNRYCLLIILFVSTTVFGVGQINLTDDKSSPDKDCVTNTSPLTSDINICPLDSESYDEFDVIECACTLPPKEDAISKLNETKNKKIGNVFKNIMNESKEQIQSFIEMSGALGIRADIENGNLCSLDALGEIIKGKTIQGKCNGAKISENSQKYFGQDFNSLIRELGKSPENNNSVGALFKIPVSERNDRQCLSENPGLQIFQNMLKEDSYQKNFEATKNFIISKAEQGVGLDDMEKRDSLFKLLPRNLKSEILTSYQRQLKEKKSPESIAASLTSLIYQKDSIQVAVKGLQSHCGFLMSSLGDLFCSDEEVVKTGNQDFFEKQMEHDPFSIDLDNDLYYATQSLYCQGQNNSFQANEANCLDNYYEAEFEQLLNPIVSFTEFDQFLGCHQSFLGNDQFIDDQRGQMIGSSRMLESKQQSLCRFLGCSNVQELALKEPSQFECQSRGDNYSLNSILLDLSKVDCQKDNNQFCLNGLMTEEFVALQKMIIIECRQTNCMSDELIREQLAISLRKNREIRDLMDTPKEELLVSHNQSNEFWERFEGDTYDLAKSSTFNAENYVKVLNDGFVGRGFQSRVIPRQQEVASPSFISQGAALEPTIVPGNSNINQRFNAEIDMGDRLESALANASRQMSILENTPEYSPDRDEAFRQLGQAQASVENIRREFDQLKSGSSRDQGLKIPNDTFEERYAEEIAAYPFNGKFSGITVGGNDGSKKNNPSVYQRSFAPTNTGTTTESVGRNINSFTDNFNEPLNDTMNSQVTDNGEVLSLPQRIEKKESADSTNNSNVELGNQGAAERSPASSIQVGNHLGDANANLIGSRAQETISQGEYLDDSVQKFEIIIDPDKDKINLDLEIANFLRVNPGFKIGQEIVIAQIDKKTGARMKARLLPLFNTDGSFKEYGVSSDSVFRERLVMAPNSPLNLKFLSRQEAYNQDMRKLSL